MLNPNDPSQVRRLLIRSTVESAGWGEIVVRLKEELGTLAEAMSLGDSDSELLMKARNWLSFREAIIRLQQIAAEERQRGISDESDFVG